MRSTTPSGSVTIFKDTNCPTALTPLSVRAARCQCTCAACLACGCMRKLISLPGPVPVTGVRALK